MGYGGAWPWPNYSNSVDFHPHKAPQTLLVDLSRQQLLRETKRLPRLEPIFFHPGRRVRLLLLRLSRGREHESGNDHIKTGKLWSHLISPPRAASAAFLR
jgi:hypothetical protein